jgi:XTP/dITP diphosphohydrolase
VKRAAAPRFDRLVLATNNRHKVGEIQAILRRSGLKIRILTLADFPKRPPVVENSRTIEGNARKKAVEVARRTGLPALADDTGLFIDALGGRPGVYSARFAGPGCTFADNNAKVLRLMKNVPGPRRRASFRCIAALALPNGKTRTAEGRISGRISAEAAGTKGFGYDPVFWVPSLRRTFAQMSAAQKNSVSHRGRAFRQVPRLWKSLLRGR